MSDIEDQMIYGLLFIMHWEHDKIRTCDLTRTSLTWKALVYYHNKQFLASYNHNPKLPCAYCNCRFASQVIYSWRLIKIVIWAPSAHTVCFPSVKDFTVEVLCSYAKFGHNRCSVLWCIRNRHPSLYKEREKHMHN